MAIGSALLALVIRTYLLLGLFVPVTVAGRSMEPTLQRGDRVLVDRTAYLWHYPARGDVIVFRCPDRADELCVKRLIGLPGETIELAAEGWRADGRLLAGLPPAELRHEDRATFRARTGSPAGTTVHWKLGAGDYFVVGDNWALSDDSRNWWPGPGLSAKLLVGKALGVR